MSKRGRGHGNSTMMSLWRRAVLAAWDYRDPISGHYDPTGESLQCHHIVYRRHWLLRYDWRNGVPLTTESHEYAHTAAGQALIWSMVDAKYLGQREQVRKHDYLVQAGKSEAEVYAEIKAELIRKIEEGRQ